MKRVLVVVLCLVLCLPLFGCDTRDGQDSTSPDRTTTTTSEVDSIYHYPTPEEYREELLKNFSNRQVSDGVLTNGSYTVTVDDFITIQCELNDRQLIEVVTITVANKNLNPSTNGTCAALAVDSILSMQPYDEASRYANVWGLYTKMSNALRTVSDNQKAGELALRGCRIAVATEVYGMAPPWAVVVTIGK